MKGEGVPGKQSIVGRVWSFVMSCYEKLRRRGGKGGEGEKESIFVTISRKIGEAYTWLKNKLISLFQLFSESITKALSGLKYFVKSCCEKLREVVLGINTHLGNSCDKKMVVPEEGSLLGEMKMLVNKIRSSLSNWFLIQNSHEMNAARLTLIGFIDLFEGFIELLECVYQKPFYLIRVFYDGFFIYLDSRKTGILTKAAWHKGKAAMAILTLIIRILGAA